MARHSAPLPPLLHRTVFLAADAAACGVSRARLRARDILRFGQGLYAHRDLEVTEAMMAAALVRKFPGSTVSGLSAARLHGIPLPTWLNTWEPGQPVHLSDAPGNRRRSTPLVTWDHSLVHGADRKAWRIPRVPALGDLSGLSSSSVQRSGTAGTGSGPTGFQARTARTDGPGVRGYSFVPMLTPARLWIQICPDLPWDWRVAVGDHLVRIPFHRADERYGRGPIESPLTLAETVSQCAALRGVALARDALPLIRVGVDSVQETRTRLAFACGRIPAPEVGEPMHDANGRIWARPDFLWREFKLVGEYDGIKHFASGAASRDQARSARLRRAGFTDVHIFYDDLPLSVPGQTDAEVRAALADCGAVRLVGEELRRLGWKSGQRR